MKKILFCMIAVGGLLTGCSNDEVINTAPENPQNAISFSGAVGKNSRGVTDITSANLSSFQVWGYESSTDNASGVVTRFDGTTVTNDGSGWTYDNKQYWTVGNYYWFAGFYSENGDAAAFVPAGTTAWPATTDTPSSRPYFGGTIYFNNGVDAWTPTGTGLQELSGAKGHSDLVYAWWKPEGAIGAEKPTVDFSFKHLLSKVAFKFVNGLPYSTIKVTALSVNGVPTQGTLDMTATSPAWNVTAPATAFNMVYSNTDISTLASIAPGANATSAYNIFIPAAFTYNITFTVELYQNNVYVATYSHTANVSGLTLAMGKAYVLTATLDLNNIDPNGALEPIMFNPTVENWVNDASNDVNVPAE